MNILLVGGNGFVGQSLIKELLSYGDNVSYLARNKNENIQNATFIKADIFNSADLKLENYDVIVHLIGTIKNKNSYKKLNRDSLEHTILLAKNNNVNKVVFLSAEGGFSNYLKYKKEAETLLLDSGLDYLIVRPGLMYGENRLSSYINVLPIKIFAKIGIPFFKKVYPLPVAKVSSKIAKILHEEPQKKFLNINDLNS